MSLQLLHENLNRRVACSLAFESMMIGWVFISVAVSVQLVEHLNHVYGGCTQHDTPISEAATFTQRWHMDESHLKKFDDQILCSFGHNISHFIERLRSHLSFIFIF